MSVDGLGFFLLIICEEERIYVKLFEMFFVIVVSNGFDWMRQCFILGNLFKFVF